MNKPSDETAVRNMITFVLTEHAHREPEDRSGHPLTGPAWFPDNLDDPTDVRIADIARCAVS